MLISAIFPSKYLTASDLCGKPYTLTIKTVTLEEMVTHENKKVQKPVCWFVSAQKGLVLNITNAHIIVGLYGDSTEQWEGKRITIYATKVKAFGSYQDAIRVREEIPAQPKPAAKAQQVEEQSGLDDDGDIADFDGTDSLDITIDPDTGEILSADKSLWEPHPDTKGSPSRKAKGPDGITPPQLLRLTKLMAQLYGADWGRLELKLAQDASTGSVSQFSHLKVKEAEVLLRQLEAGIKQGSNGKVTA